MRTPELLERLQRHYIKPGPMPGYVFLPECGINGGSQSRADALAVGFTSTSGRLLVGHELKVSRADWRHELDQQGKADLWADNCHAWYVVAPSTDIVPKEEVPHGWGLMVPSTRTKTRMDVVVKATVYPERQPSWKVVRSMMARLDTLQAGQINAIRRTARDEAREEARIETERLRGLSGDDRLTHEQRERLDSLDRLEKALGKTLGYAWGTDAADSDKIDPRTAAAALRVVEAFAKVHGRHRLEHVTQHLRGSAQAVLDHLEEYEHATAALLDLNNLERV